MKESSKEGKKPNLIHNNTVINVELENSIIHADNDDDDDMICLSIKEWKGENLNLD